jgi:FkbM family methyltransferase
MRENVCVTGRIDELNRAASNELDFNSSSSAGIKAASVLSSQNEGGYHSHQGQDKWVIERVLPGKREGWFIDSGAGPDGVRGSNSYVMESRLGWKGLLVEPHPECFKQVKANRSAIVAQYCLTDSFGEVEFVINEHPELSSIPEHLSEPDFVAAGYAHKQLPKVKIQTAPLWELLRRHNFPPVIDYMSLDIEGAEWVALKDFPFKEFRILCMTIEHNAKFHGKLRAKLHKEGYRLVRVVTPDDFYVHKSVDYRMTFGERVDTWLRSTWHMIYFREPMLTVRRIARWARRQIGGY